MEGVPSGPVGREGVRHAQGEVPQREGQSKGAGSGGLYQRVEKQIFGWELDEENDVWTSSGVRVRVVKGESERKNKPCVCVRKELPGEFLKPL